MTGGDTTVPLYADVLAAGMAAAAYAVYFSMPYRMIVWPVIAGMAAHTVHWWAMTAWHASLATAAFLACLLVGAALVPIAHRLQMPLAAIGFAAVVALVPGVYVFPMLSGLVQLPTGASPELLATTVSNGATAALVVTGIALGLVIPMRVRDAIIGAWNSRIRRDRSSPRG